jgi:hypothetical protein
MALNAENIADLLLETQEGLIKRGAFVGLQTDLTDFVGTRELWQNRQKAFLNGLYWRFDCQMDHNHSYRHVGLYQTDASAVMDTMKKGTVTVRHVNASYIYDLREPDLQMGGTAVVDYVKSKYTSMMYSFHDGLETDIWSDPGASDDTAPHGVPYWITKGTAGQEGFYGLDPSGYSTGRANISSTDYARWANYFADYTDVSVADLIRKMRKCTKAIQFRSPVSHPEPTLGAGKNGIYANQDTTLLLEELLRGQNMNLGYDLDPTGGRATFQSQPVMYVPKLNADASDPIYFIDWKWFAIGCMPGWENNLTKPYPLADAHLVRRVDLDASLELICTNLRKQAVFAKV